MKYTDLVVNLRFNKKTLSSFLNSILVSISNSHKCEGSQPCENTMESNEIYILKISIFKMEEKKFTNKRDKGVFYFTKRD